jgi:hypothetical protein
MGADRKGEGAVPAVVGAQCLWNGEQRLGGKWAELEAAARVALGRRMGKLSRARASERCGFANHHSTDPKDRVDTRSMVM